MCLANEGLRRAELRPGMRLLDVAAGSGALSVPAARLGARVVAVDLSPTMIDRLNVRAREEGLSLEAYVMDGHSLELEDNTFDISGSQFGVMLFPDLPCALREMARVTRPGGRVLMNVYGPPERVEFLTFFIAAMKAVVPGFTGLPTDPPPLPFQVSDPKVLHQRMAEAGLKDISIEPGTEKLEFRSGKDMWEWVVNSNPIGAMMVVGLMEDQKADVQQVLDGMLRECSVGGPTAVLNCEVNIGFVAK
jgi:ubiquinone/menaquinone biosynthesis C-methylase UbiE